jgi:nucleoid-associated protein YgaU
MTSVQLRDRPPAPGPDAGRAGRPAPLRLTRRGRRLVAGLSIGAGLGIAVLAGAVDDADSGALRLAGDSSVVVQSGDTLWSIAAQAAPGEDTRAVVDAIMAVNDLSGVGLVPGQVLQLP